MFTGTVIGLSLVLGSNVEDSANPPSSGHTATVNSDADVVYEPSPRRMVVGRVGPALIGGGIGVVALSSIPIAFAIEALAPGVAWPIAGVSLTQTAGGIAMIAAGGHLTALYRRWPNDPHPAPWSGAGFSTGGAAALGLGLLGTGLGAYATSRGVGSAAFGPTVLALSLASLASAPVLLGLGRKRRLRFERFWQRRGVRFTFVPLVLGLTWARW